MTKTQMKLLQVIAYHIRTNGFCPSYDRLASEIDVSSKSGIHRLVTALKERGYLKSEVGGKARACSLELTKKGKQATQGATQVQLLAVKDVIAKRIADKRFEYSQMTGPEAAKLISDQLLEGAL